MGDEFATREAGTFVPSRRCLAELVNRFASAHQLSCREREVLLLLVHGTNQKAIGDVIGCGHASVRTHLRRMCRKLGCAGTLELVLRLLSESLGNDEKTLG
jgi:DNA-binding CsgD family transcriptional regulator